MVAKSKKSAPAVEVAGTTISGDANERKWRAEHALRTLTEAERVKKDPALMKEVEKARKAKMADLASIKVETSKNTIKGMK